MNDRSQIEMSRNVPLRAQHGVDKIMIRIGFIDEATPGAVHRDQAGLGAIQYDVWKYRLRPIGTAQHRAGHPQRRTAQVVIETGAGLERH